MGLIADLIRSAFRDYTTDGVAASGVANVDKAMVRSLGPALESAIANASLGALVTVAYSTRAALNADLAHADRTVALVYGDATDANNDLYVKSGASGAGSWTLTNAFHQLLLAAGAQTAALAVPFLGWSQLSAVSGRAGDRATVLAVDTGTHTDPLTSATVNNAGVYRYSTSPAGWTRTGDLDSQTAQAWASLLAANSSVQADLGLTSDGAAVIAGFYDAQAGRNMILGVDSLLRLLINGLLAPIGAQMVLGRDTMIARGESNYALLGEDSAGYPLFGYCLDDLTWWARNVGAIDDIKVGGASYLDNVAALRPDRLTRWRSGVANLADGGSQLVTLGLIGDSWTYFASLYSPRLQSRLRTSYGDGGDGFIAFATSSGLPSAPAAVSRTATSVFVVTKAVGAWNHNASYNAPTANLTEQVSAASGNRLQIAATGASVNTVLRLLYRPIAGSSVRYSWDGGSTWQGTIDLSTGYAATLASLPASGTWTLLIEDNGSTARCALTGLIARKASGVLVHKVGSPGSTSAQWAAQAGAAGFQAHWAELAPDAISILHGTNDQTNGATAGSVAANYNAIAAGVRAGATWTRQPPVDLLYAAPAENLRGIKPAMADYARAIRKQALLDGAAFLDLQTAMGPVTAIDWWQLDLIHPTETYGGPGMTRPFHLTFDR